MSQSEGTVNILEEEAERELFGHATDEDVVDDEVERDEYGCKIEPTSEFKADENQDKVMTHVSIDCKEIRTKGIVTLEKKHKNSPQG